MARSKVKKVANAEIRAAKTFLNKKGLSTEGRCVRYLVSIFREAEEE